jgi:RTX calcium-binding nonapeptide repeat (4 copies)
MKPVVASLFVLLCLAMPASAGAARVELDLESSQLGSETLENLEYVGDPGERNKLTLRFDGEDVYELSDPAGITPGRGCSLVTPTDSTRARCVQSPGGTTLGGVLVRLGDGNDRARIFGAGAVVLGGAGSDVLYGSGRRDTLSAGTSETRPARARTRDRLYGRGNSDRLIGSRGANRMSGGQGADVVSSGRGPDRIRDRDGEVDEVRCGGGRDVARLDAFDFTADGCRTVRRPSVAAATPLDLFTAEASAFVVVGCPADSRLRRCRGTVRLSRGSRSLGSRRFNIARRRRQTRGIPLPRDIVDRIGPSGGPTVRVSVRSRSSARTRTTFFVRLPLPPPGD